jgi:hypothetical protein
MRRPDRVVAYPAGRTAPIDLTLGEAQRRGLHAAFAFNSRRVGIREGINGSDIQLATLLGSASLLTMANAMARTLSRSPSADGAAAQEVPERVLITDSLIGTAPVGVPVTNLSPQDFAQTGA